VAQRNDRPAGAIQQTEFGLQVRLPQVLIFSHLQNTGSHGFGREKHRKSANEHGISQSVAERCGGALGGKLPPRLAGHGIIRKERHLKRLRSAYLAYYQEDRTHLGLAKDTPAGRLQQSALEPKARFNTWRDSAACIIGMQPA
jgi:hypothetical protein